jgi:hypothetical protein
MLIVKKFQLLVKISFPVELAVRGIIVKAAIAKNIFV